MLQSELGDLHESIGSYDPLCIPNAMKIPLLRRNRHKNNYDSDPQFCLEPTNSNNSFIPLTVSQSTFDNAQKLQLIRQAKQTLQYIDLSTSSTIIQSNQIIVNAMKNDMNSCHLFNFICCFDQGLRIHHFNMDSWCENSLSKALEAIKMDSNLRVLWSSMLTKMHITHVENTLASDLLFLFVNKFTKERCMDSSGLQRIPCQKR